MTKPTKWLCAQRRLRSAWASAQSDQSSLCAQWGLRTQAFFMQLSSCRQGGLWSDWADAQADLSLCWPHMPFCWFCHEAAQFLFCACLVSSLIRVYTVCHSVCIVWTHYSMVQPHSSNFRVITTKCLGVPIFRKFTVKWLEQTAGFCYLCKDTSQQVSKTDYRKFPKYSDTQKICCNHSKMNYVALP